MATEYNLSYTASEVETKLATVDEIKDNLDNNYYTSTDIDTKIDELNGSIENKADLVDGKIPAEQLPDNEVDLSEYYTKSEIYNKSEIDDNYYTKSEIDDSFDSINTNLGNYYTKSDVYTKTEVNSTVEDISGAIEDINSELDNRYQKSEVYNKTEINSTVDGINNAINNRYTKSDVYTKTEAYNKTEVYNKTETEAKIVEKAYTKEQTYNKNEIDASLQTKMASTLLWTNPSPDANFGEQNLDIDPNNEYSAYTVYCVVKTGASTYATSPFVFSKDGPVGIQYTTTKDETYFRRLAFTTKNFFNVGKGQFISTSLVENTETNQLELKKESTTDNSLLVPLKIYGWKGINSPVSSSIKIGLTQNYHNFNNILYTEMEELDGWWGADGNYDGTDRIHSQAIPVIGKNTYYVGVKFDKDSSSTDVTCAGAFFDAMGNWIAPLLTENVSQISYLNANGNRDAGSSYTKYAPIYSFTAPAGAYYVSLNLSVNPTKTYRQYISSKPIFAFWNTGNYAWSDNDPLYQKTKDKKLCVFGASGVAVNRLYTGNDSVAAGGGHKISDEDIQKGNKVALNQYVSGFQEYLVPWYKEVDSYGYWGYGWQTVGNSKEILPKVIDVLDLSSYDEFIINPATNDLTDVDYVGTIDGDDTDTYMKNMKKIINYIYAQKPNAKIYLVNVAHKRTYYSNSTTKQIQDTLNDQLKELSFKYSAHLIDIASKSGFNEYTYGSGKYTYDNTHASQDGSKVLGLCMRQEILGF